MNMKPDRPLLDHVVDLRALVSRLRQTLRDIAPYQSSPLAQNRITEALADDDHAAAREES